MVRQSRPVAHLASVMLAGVAATVMVGLAACGTVVAGSTKHPAAAGGASAPPGASKTSAQPAASGAAAMPAPVPAHVPLCAAIARLDRMVVSRPRNGLPFREVPPAGTMVRDPARIRALARALCTLPPQPRGVYPCPALFGGAFRLLFATAQRGFAPVQVQLTGCRVVTGLGPARWWARAPHLIVVLSHALGSKVSLTTGKHGVPPTY